MNQRRHGRQEFFVANEGVFGEDADGNAVKREATPTELTRRFLFSRVGPVGKQLDTGLLQKVAQTMVAPTGPLTPSKIPAGYTYLGQFADHDMTLDKTAVALGANVTVEELQQGRSPTLDLDTLYGLGPIKDAAFYDGIRLAIGTTDRVAFPANDPAVNRELAGFDLPRVGVGPNLGAMRKANIPDLRNDENVAIAQLHVAFIRFHNAIVDELERRGVTGDVFTRARAEVVKHYQWMLREDFLPRICDPQVVEDVFTSGRRHIAADLHDDNATMPIEFSVGAFRIGHSMIRAAYDWNRVFGRIGPGGPATLAHLFRFGGTLGTLSPDADERRPDTTGSFKRLPTSWIADWRRWFDLAADTGDASLAAPPGTLNFAEKINTTVTPPLSELPASFVAIFGGAANLPFRSLVRARMVSLASGQQMAALFGLEPLTPEQLLVGKGGADLTRLTDAEKSQFLADTPLWFYVLREAEIAADGERLGPLGSRIVVETFHRAMEASRFSILRDPTWRPARGVNGRFGIAQLLLASVSTPSQLFPLG